MLSPDENCDKERKYAWPTHVYDKAHDFEVTGMLVDGSLRQTRQEMRMTNTRAPPSMADAVDSTASTSTSATTKENYRTTTSATPNPSIAGWPGWRRSRLKDAGTLALVRYGTRQHDTAALC